ncbi:LINE-1 retrotransposable element ORF2 protein [Symbiodinium microadriaticum]|uniref:LINE-1 retrotransposable element ORF2 protein n=3 Tax=Symbiodinium microadriaticum TaxID=2951 RepID=A0A1Q9BXA2_SYMMI|nr:LINE-1 retrotransposable element ORF2 protein [Symbiodinium microadriaticum]
MDPEGRAEAMREHRLQPRKTGTLLRMAIFLVAGFQLGCTMATQLEVQKQNNGEPAGVGPRLGAHLHLLVPYYDHPLARDAEPLEIPRLTALHHCPAPSSWSLRKVLKRQVIVARASRSFCKPVHWTKLKPSYKGSTPISSVSFSRTSPPAHEQASWHGTREMWQKSIGTPCVPKQTNTCKAAGWCNGRTGRWLTPVGDDMQASPEHEMAAFFWWTQTSVPWRPHPLRASQFQLYASRAVPPHIAPAAMWRLCSDPVGALLGPALNKHYSQGQVASAEGDWKNTNVIWLPKPHKKPITVASMRPIGLQSPATKSFASALKVAVMEHLQPVVRDLPQYAYLPHRGTTDALLKVHQHFERTAALIAANRIDRFQQKAGKQRSACVGGVSLSLDLSSAFDGVHRPTAYHTMLQHGVDRTTVNIIQSLHQQAQYHFTVGGCTDFVCTTNGIKQGCTIAPSIWAFFTVAVMLKLVEARSMEWLQQVCTLFADDCWGSWLIRTPKDVARAVADIAHIIAVLEDFHLSVNYQKTAVLLRLEGKQAAQALADCTVEKEGNTYLEVDITGVIRLIPIKSQHEYLGTTVSYHHRQDNNTAKRMQAGQLRYQDIRRRFYRYPAKEVTPAEPQQSTADTVNSVPCSFNFALQSPFAGMADTDAQLTEDIYHACFPSGQTPLLQSPVDPNQSFPNKRPRPEFRSRARPGDRRGHNMYHPSPFQAPLPSSAGVSGDTFTQMCRLLLRHEEQLALIRQDRGLIVFVKQDQHSILPALYKASATWNEKKEKAANLEAGLSLKTVLLSCVIRELLSRLQTVTSTEDGKAKLLAAGWINNEGHWLYQRWCAKTKRLIRDEDRTPLTHDNAVRLLTSLRDSLNGDIIHKFAATQPLYKLEEAGHQSATFFLEVSLRGKESDLVHAMLLQLINSSLTHLIGISVKRENGQRCKLAQQVAELVFRG